MTYQDNQSTIVAQATPVGSGGVGIIRISGRLTQNLMQQILHRTLAPRYAYYGDFYGADDQLIDRGIAIYFPAPHSFTGEDVLELQGHGGQMVMQLLLNRALALGAKLANPGEFSYRAFCNGKLDLTQAEAIADLIAASSELAAKQAIRSLQGDFAKLIQAVVTKLIKIRTNLEYTLDFTEDELLLDQATLRDYQSELQTALAALLTQIKQVLTSAKLGLKIQEGIKIAIIGKPNAGKSTLFNCLCGCQRAIVTDIPGTTRDLLRATVQLAGGLQIELIDTAGFRDDPDQVEAMGINLAWQELQTADHVIYILDASKIEPSDGLAFIDTFLDKLPLKTTVTMVYNKMDLVHQEVCMTLQPHQLTDRVWELSAAFKTGANLEQLMQHLYTQLAPRNLVDSGFSARQRHVSKLTEAVQDLQQAINYLQVSKPDWVIVAEALRLMHVALNNITGQDSTEELLNSVFSSFCVGK